MNQELLYATVMADHRVRSLYDHREHHAREATRRHVAKRRAGRARLRRALAARLNIGARIPSASARRTVNNEATPQEVA